MIPEIKIEDYTYDLPDGRIAKYPLPERDSSKLLCYDNGKIEEKVFKEISSLIPEESMMVFNDESCSRKAPLCQADRRSY